MGHIPAVAGSATLENRSRVLVVDDNLDAVHSMATLLRVMGHDAHFAINGFAAIDVARTFYPEVIARQLSLSRVLERRHIISVTSRSGEETQPRVLESGCEALYVKPLAPSTLEEYRVLTRST